MNRNVLITGSFIVDLFNEPVKKALGPNEGVSTKIHTYLGGNSFNVAKDLVKLDFPNKQITCLGAIGDDAFGNIFLLELQHLGIKSGLYREKKVPTSKIFMLKVENEEPRYYFDEGANAYLPPEFVISKITKNKPAVFYIGEAGCLKRNSPQFPLMMKTAKSAGCLTIVDTVIPSNGDWSFINDSTAYIDILKCNEFEALSLTGSGDITTAVKCLSQTGIPLVIISLADKGSIFCYKKVLYEVPAFTVSCIDATGAGDAFIAGLIKILYGFGGSALEDRLDKDESNLWTAMIYSSACGAAAVTADGCHDGVQENRITQLILEHGKQVFDGIKKL